MQSTNEEDPGCVRCGAVYNDESNGNGVTEADGTRVTWAYDSNNQLIGERRSGASGYANTFVYDPVGNRLVLNESGTKTTTTYDAANQIQYSEALSGRTTYTFDADRNQQIVQQPNGDRTTNIWDYENRLKAVALPDATRVSMSYNAENRRVSREES